MQTNTSQSLKGVGVPSSGLRGPPRSKLYTRVSSEPPPLSNFDLCWFARKILTTALIDVSRKLSLAPCASPMRRQAPCTSHPRSRRFLRTLQTFMITNSMAHEVFWKSRWNSSLENSRVAGHKSVVMSRKSTRAWVRSARGSWMQQRRTRR